MVQKKSLAAPYLVWMAAFIIAPLIIVVYYASRTVRAILHWTI